MHNPLREGAESRDLTLPQIALIAPIVAVIVALALYPQFVLERTEESTLSSVAPAAIAADSPLGAKELTLFGEGVSEYSP
jgi:NADH:ubiquinone oxidoreductase subunit 4 (subunit M)